jgi:hypothetical protein
VSSRRQSQLSRTKINFEQQRDQILTNLFKQLSLLFVSGSISFALFLQIFQVLAVLNESSHHCLDSLRGFILPKLSSLRVCHHFFVSLALHKASKPSLYRNNLLHLVPKY